MIAGIMLYTLYWVCEFHRLKYHKFVIFWLLVVQEFLLLNISLAIGILFISIRDINNYYKQYNVYDKLDTLMCMLCNLICWEGTITINTYCGVSVYCLNKYEKGIHNLIYEYILNYNHFIIVKIDSEQDLYYKSLIIQDELSQLIPLVRILLTNEYCIIADTEDRNLFKVEEISQSSNYMYNNNLFELIKEDIRTDSLINVCENELMYKIFEFSRQHNLKFKIINCA